jgi:hypothetical protein
MIRENEKNRRNLRRKIKSSKKVVLRAKKE